MIQNNIKENHKYFNIIKKLDEFYNRQSRISSDKIL